MITGVQSSMEANISSQRRLILFGRYPVPGKTKTRLIPILGSLGAAELQRNLTLKSLSTITAPTLENTDVAYCFSGASRAMVRRWLGPQPVGLMEQKGGHLGERMRTALFESFDRGFRQVILVGTDIPQMTPVHLEAAFHALTRHDLVLGPSKDGGYWLVGLNQKADLFRRIEWGSPAVLRQTLAAARKLGLSATQIATLNDMDTEADLIDGLPPEQWRRPYLSVIIPALNEERAIASRIRQIQTCQCEVLVADGGSEDRTVEIARECGATVITGPRGRARQQNAGAGKAHGKILLFLHADTALPPDFEHQVFNTLMGHRVVAGAFRFKTDYDHWSMRLIEKTVQIRSRLLQMPYGDQALFMPKTVFEKAGGFPLVPIAEDLYLVRRLGRLGRVALAQGAAVTSGRRWRNLGVWRTTFINYLIAIGCIMGANPHRLAPLYRIKK
jgi:rSAM/selenodomain-associated transferase 2/rSAM/selenodomain-associated transferase 1